MQRVLAARGANIGLEEAARLSTALLELAELGVLVPVEKPEAKATQAASSDSSLGQETEAGT